MSLFTRFFSFTSSRNNRAKLGIFIALFLLSMNLFATVDSITILNGTECEETGFCQYRMQFSSLFSIDPNYPEDYDYYRNHNKSSRNKPYGSF